MERCYCYEKFYGVAKPEGSEFNCFRENCANWVRNKSIGGRGIMQPPKGLNPGKPPSCGSSVQRPQATHTQAAACKEVKS